MVTTLITLIIFILFNHASFSNKNLINQKEYIMKIVSINYFDQVLDQVALEAYKQTAEYAEGVERCEGDWAFAHYQDEVEAEFTNTVTTAEGDTNIAIDYATQSEYGITCYIRDAGGMSIPVVRFKFEGAKLGAADRELTSAEKELLKNIVSVFNLTNIEL